MYVFCFGIFTYRLRRQGRSKRRIYFYFQPELRGRKKPCRYRKGRVSRKLLQRKENGTTARTFKDTYVTKEGAQSYESYPWRSGSELIIEAEAGVKFTRVGYRPGGYGSERTGANFRRFRYADFRVGRNFKNTSKTRPVLRGRGAKGLRCAEKGYGFAVPRRRFSNAVYARFVCRVSRFGAHRKRRSTDICAQFTADLPSLAAGTAGIK